MANYNARDFLRDSIAGNTSGGISQPKANASGDFTTYPILFPNQGQSIENFIVSTEQNLNLSFYKNYQSYDEKTNFLHSLALFNEAVNSIKNTNYKQASDLFSLIIVLSPNYFYSYLFALIRYSLSDNVSALNLLNVAQKQIAEGVKLAPELINFTQAINFNENYYVFYLMNLIDNNQTTTAEQFLDFILEHHLLKNITLLLRLIYSFSYNKVKVKALIQEVIPLISEVTDLNLKKDLTEKLKIVSRGTN